MFINLEKLNCNPNVTNTNPPLVSLSMVPYLILAVIGQEDRHSHFTERILRLREGMTLVQSHTGDRIWGRN